MTNYEWLLQMGGEERQAWFNAEHVDANDVLTRKGDVRADGVCANDGFMDLDSCTHGVRTFASETDSREKLEADIDDYLESEYGIVPGVVAMIPEWLDRQAAITAEETSDVWEEYRDATQREIAELTAERDKLESEAQVWRDGFEKSMREREQYRELFSKSLTLAAEIVNLQP